LRTNTLALAMSAALTIIGAPKEGARAADYSAIRQYEKSRQACRGHHCVRRYSSCPESPSYCYSLYGAYGPYGGTRFWGAFTSSGWGRRY
jgi:hypothetical protein